MKFLYNCLTGPKYFRDCIVGGDQSHRKGFF